MAHMGDADIVAIQTTQTVAAVLLRVEVKRVLLVSCPFDVGRIAV